MMNNKLIFTLGRIVFGLPFLVFGLNHMMAAEQMASMVPGFFPYALYWVYFTGLALLMAGLAIIANRWVKWACYGLALFLVMVISTIHVPMFLAGTNMPMPMINLLKDFGLLGGALMLSTSDN